MFNIHTKGFVCWYTFNTHTKDFHVIIKIIQCIALAILRMEMCKYVSESVDSLCRDDVNMHVIYAILKQKLYNFATNRLKALCPAFPFSAFVISKTHIVAQKPRGRWLNTKVYGG